MRLDVFMVAGEASADLHGSAMLRELRRLYPEIHCFGVGGKRLAEAGMEIVVPSHSLNVMGLSDWFNKMSEVFRSYRKTVETIRRRRPDVAILLDLPDFNLMMAAKLKRLGIPVVYYISPQVWAWRRYRVRKIKRLVDEMLVLFPFEKEFYDRADVPCVFVGHPLVEMISQKREHRSQSDIIAAPRIAILPGSRRSEILHHGKLVGEVVQKLKARFPTAEFTVPVANTLDENWVKEQIGVAGVQFSSQGVDVVYESADVGIVASGTATLETALKGLPFCLFYKVSASSAWLFKTFAGYRDFIGMPNLLRRKEVVREFFQESATADRIAEEAAKMIENEVYRLQIVEELSQCRSMLGGTGASQRAALQVHRLLKSLQTKTRSHGVPLPTTS